MRLTSFSQRFLEFLAQKAPDLHHAVKPTSDVEGKPTGFLLIEVPSPNPRASRPLWVTTEDDEVTVGFDAFHTHFANWDASSPEPQSFPAALSLARDITSERVLIISWWFDGKWSGSQITDAGVVPARPEYVPVGATIRCRSWSGLKDHDGQG